MRYCGPPASRFRPPPAISAHRAGGPQPLCLSAARQLFPPSACNLGSSSRRAAASLPFRRLPVVSALRLQFRLIEPEDRSLSVFPPPASCFRPLPAIPAHRAGGPQPPAAEARSSSTSLAPSAGCDPTAPPSAVAVGGEPPCAAQSRDYRRSDPNIRDRAPRCIDVCNRLMPV